MALQSRLYSLVAQQLGGSLVGSTEPPQRIYLENLPCILYLSYTLVSMYSIPDRACIMLVVL